MVLILDIEFEMPESSSETGLGWRYKFGYCQQRHGSQSLESIFVEYVLCIEHLILRVLCGTLEI